MSKKKLKIPPHSKKKNLINDKVALLQGDEDEANKTFKISFDYYNDTNCEIKNLEVAPSRKCLSNLKQIGRSNQKNLRSNNITPSRVHNSGHYKRLFSKLTEDVDLFEIDIGSASRLFYFTCENFFHIVAIKNSHFKY